MKPAPFEYHAPDSIDQVLELLQEHGDTAKLLAGGQSLVPAMNFRVVQPAMLVDLNRISEMDYVREEECLHIGAMTRERALEFDKRIAERSPLLHEAAPHIAHPQIRNRGTIGGSIVNADPAAELPVLMIALNARLRARSVSGERWMEAQDFFAGMFTTALEPNEVLMEIEIPFIQARTGWSFMEVAPRTGDYALMGVAALITLTEDGKCHHAKIVFLNAGDGPMDAKESARLLAGQPINDHSIDAAAALASEKEITPYGNIHASPAFQRHLANILTKRALKQAGERAGATQ